MVDIYTDVAVRQGTAAAAVIALSDKDFIGYYTYVFKGTSNSTYGELKAILEGIKSLELKQGETYVVHTDSSSALRFLKSPVAYHKSKLCSGVAQEILKEVEGIDITFSLRVGHMSEHGPNKVVDKASHYILLSVLTEET